ncbi:MAG: sulfate reduction electron transfer complex DsrMKJOP subunit DsrM [Candidatus Zixiibacteriota bacterium]|nr:MAG: sulfate reduction electron transfer complex DsrMKJOP subunit DsrM [candidate division Zixibacteria bacterium]
MNALYALFVVILLLLVAWIGIGTVNLHILFGIVLPYLAFAIFVLGFFYRIIKWAGSPVPFRIPATCGQQKSLPWIKNSKLDNPHNAFWTIIRMALEILTFRSLFRSTRAELRDDQRIAYGDTKWLWAGALAFHWTFLIIILRHYRFFAEPVPGFVLFLQNIDGLFQVGLPVVYITDAVIVLAATYLFIRRVFIPQVRYISLFADYFPLFLIGGIAVTGILMRYFTKVDVSAVKELTLGWINFNPVAPEGIGIMFYLHLFLVSVLFAYFPFSKLMHMGGIFLSPARNLANNNRARRHVNPWNYDVKTHTYEEYEDEFRDVMKEAGMPLEKE